MAASIALPPSANIRAPASLAAWLFAATIPRSPVGSLRSTVRHPYCIPAPFSAFRLL